MFSKSFILLWYPEFYFKLSILKVSKRWECQKNYLHGFFNKNYNFPKFTQNLAQISQKVYGFGLYFWFMKNHTPGPWLCLSFEAFMVWFISDVQKSWNLDKQLVVCDYAPCFNDTLAHKQTPKTKLFDSYWGKLEITESFMTRFILSWKFDPTFLYV